MKIFDSLVHLMGKEPLDQEISRIEREMKTVGIDRAVAIYFGDSADLRKSNRELISALSQRTAFYPVAMVDLTSSIIREELEFLSGLGFRGVKIHPRRFQRRMSDRVVCQAIETAADLGMIVFLCTYTHEVAGQYPKMPDLVALAQAISNRPSAHMVLLHGGDVRLLEYAEFVRMNVNCLLDLSFTLMKYQGSSLDLDLKFLFQSFDQRVCVGTDYPEFSFGDFTARLDQLTQGLSEEKKSNIFSMNLSRFLSV